MSKNNGWLIVLGILVAIGGAILISDNLAKSAEIARLKKKIEDDDEIDCQIKLKLNELLNRTPNLSPEVKEELHQITNLLNQKNELKATFAMGKILENILKKRYENIEQVKEIAKQNGRKKPVFTDYIECSKKINDVSQEEYHLLSVLKLYRNEEAHELAVKKEKFKIESVLLIGMVLIAKFAA